MIESKFVKGSAGQEQRLEQARELLRQQPAISRWKLSRQLAALWECYYPTGELRDMMVRTCIDAHK